MQNAPLHSPRTQANNFDNSRPLSSLLACLTNARAYLFPNPMFSGRSEVATYVYEAQRRCYGAPSAVDPLCGALNDKLRAGDTLVVSGVGCLGETYVEISDALRDLMRRRVLVRVVNERHTFDGSIEDARSQAWRDSLIASAAAAAEIEKTVTRGIKSQPADLDKLVWPQLREKDGNSSFLQLCVVGAQVGALAVAAYFISFTTQRANQPPLMQVSVINAAQGEARISESSRETTKEIVVGKGTTTRPL